MGLMLFDANLFSRAAVASTAPVPLAIQSIITQTDRSGNQQRLASPVRTFFSPILANSKHFTQLIICRHMMLRLSPTSMRLEESRFSEEFSRVAGPVFTPIQRVKPSRGTRLLSAPP